MYTLTTSGRPTGRQASAVLLAVLAALSFVAAACGDDDEKSSSKSSDERETTTTAKDADSAGIASGILRSAGAERFGGFSEDVEVCIGSSIIDSLGEEEAVAMADAAPDTYTEEQLDALVTSFDECVPGSLLAESMTVSFYESSGATSEPSARTIACVTEKLDGLTGQVVKEGVEAEASGTLPEVAVGIFDSCVPNEDIVLILKSAFLKNGLSEAQATCVADALSGQITISELANAGISGDASALQEKVQAVASACP